MGSQQTAQVRGNPRFPQEKTTVKAMERHYQSEPPREAATPTETARTETPNKRKGTPPQATKFFSCMNPMHEEEPLTMVCVDESCRNRSMICVHCQESNHWNHKVTTLHEFIRHVDEVQNETTTASFIKHSIKSIEQLRQNFNSHVESTKDRVLKVFQQIKTEADGYFGRVESMLKNEQAAYEKLSKENLLGDKDKDQEEMMFAYRRQAERLIGCRHYRGQLVTQLDSLQKKLAEEQKERLKKIEEQSNVLAETCKQLQIVMEQGVERFRYRESSKVEPIKPGNNWRQAIFQANPVKLSQSTESNQDQIETVANSNLADAHVVIPKRKHVQPYRGSNLARPLFEDKDKIFEVVEAWNQTLSNENAFVGDKGRRVTRLLDSNDIVGALADTPLNQTRLPIYTWTIRVMKMKRKMAMGIRLAEKSRRFGHIFMSNSGEKHLSNGHYVFTTDGWLHSREQQRSDSALKQGFSIEEGDCVVLRYSLEDGRLEAFRDGISLCSFDVKAAPVNDFYHPCVYLWNGEDAAEIVQERTSQSF